MVSVEGDHTRARCEFFGYYGHNCYSMKTLACIPAPEQQYHPASQSLDFLAPGIVNIRIPPRFATLVFLCEVKHGFVLSWNVDNRSMTPNRQTLPKTTRAQADIIHRARPLYRYTENINKINIKTFGEKLTTCANQDVSVCGHLARLHLLSLPFPQG